MVPCLVVAMKKQSQPKPGFVSDQVSEARRYYLNLNPSPTAPLTVVCGGVERMQADYVVSRERFPYFGIELVAEGQGELTLHDQPFPLSPGIMFAYGPQTPHRIVNRPPDRMRKYYVDVAGRDAEAALTAAGLLQRKPLRVARMHELVELFELLDHEAGGDSSVVGDVCEQVLRLLLVKIRQCSLAEGVVLPRAYATYERVRDYIETHYLSLTTAEAVAAQCDLTPIHLSRLFRRFGGVGVYQFLLRKRMNRAAEMLLEDRMLVKEVADRLGFADAFQFSRAFKRVYGIPPNHLVANRLAAGDKRRR